MRRPRRCGFGHGQQVVLLRVVWLVVLHVELLCLVVVLLSLVQLLLLLHMQLLLLRLRHQAVLQQLLVLLRV